MDFSIDKAKAKIHSGIQNEEQAGTAVERSVEKLRDGAEALGIELDGE